MCTQLNLCERKADGHMWVPGCCLHKLSCQPTSREAQFLSLSSPQLGRQATKIGGHWSSLFRKMQKILKDKMPRSFILCGMWWWLFFGYFYNFTIFFIFGRTTTSTTTIAALWHGRPSKFCYQLRSYSCNHGYSSPAATCSALALHRCSTGFFFNKWKGKHDVQWSIRTVEEIKSCEE